MMWEWDCALFRKLPYRQALSHKKFQFGTPPSSIHPTHYSAKCSYHTCIAVYLRLHCAWQIWFWFPIIRIGCMYRILRSKCWMFSPQESDESYVVGHAPSCEANEDSRFYGCCPFRCLRRKKKSKPVPKTKRSSDGLPTGRYEVRNIGKKRQLSNPEKWGFFTHGVGRPI